MIDSKTAGIITIGGSVIGGEGEQSGSVLTTGQMQSIKIGRDLIGGDGILSGRIRASELVGSTAMWAVQIGGSLVGGTATDSGQIFCLGNIRSIKIGGDLVGGDVAKAENISGTGLIRGDNIGSILIGGSIIAGTNTGDGQLVNSGAIRATHRIDSITVKGSLLGNETQRVVITARGESSASADADMAIGKLFVGGSVENSDILAGYSDSVLPIAVNGNASIGPVTVGGAWHASNLVAGILDGGETGFGNQDDTVINKANDTLIAKIASIQISGPVTGTTNPNDHFGFAAQEIASFKIGNRTLPQSFPIELAPLTDDVTARKV